MKINIAVFASGSGSNAEKIIQHFEGHPDITVKVILSNKKNAYVLERAEKHNITSQVFSREDFYNSSNVTDILEKSEVHWIVLAGFLWLIPISLIENYKNKIINIHPSLLPKYGGKGMYGKHVHQSVFDNMEAESGITIHYVNEAYDEGQVIFQKSITLDVCDTPDIIAKKVQTLEHQYFPKIIENTILSDQ